MRCTVPSVCAYSLSNLVSFVNRFFSVSVAIVSVRFVCSVSLTRFGFRCQAFCFVACFRRLDFDLLRLAWFRLLCQSFFSRGLLDCANLASLTVALILSNLGHIVKTVLFGCQSVSGPFPSTAPRVSHTFGSAVNGFFRCLDFSCEPKIPSLHAKTSLNSIGCQALF